MIPNYISLWLDVIEKMQNENTYKLAWGRSILECIYNKVYKEDGDNIMVSLDDISANILKYYWNQSFFFGLYQAPKSAKQPQIVNIVQDLIDKYTAYKNDVYPVWYDKALPDLIQLGIYDKAIKKISNVLPQNVLGRFKMVDGDELDLYCFDTKTPQKAIIFRKNDVLLLQEYNFVLSKLFNYKWTQLLEKFNYAPRIANKVNAIAISKIRRSSLSKYKEELLKEFKDGKPIDFYTGKVLDLNDISVDHVIPRSFMYSDDIWNLVLTSRSNNSSKSNRPPSEEEIKKLKERNEHLYDIKALTENFARELEEANKNNYVDKYYYECKK